MFAFTTQAGELNQYEWNMTQLHEHSTYMSLPTQLIDNQQRKLPILVVCVTNMITQAGEKTKTLAEHNDCCMTPNIQAYLAQLIDNQQSQLPILAV